MSKKPLPKKTPAEEQLLWDLSDDKQIEEFIYELQARISNDQIMTAGLVLLLKEIENQENLTRARDFCEKIIALLFPWTIDSDEALRKYVRSLKTRKVSEFI